MARRKEIMVLGLFKEDEDCLDDFGSQLLASIQSVATVVRVNSKTAFKKAMRKKPVPSAILVVDAAIARMEYLHIGVRLREYVEDGGTLICCFEFPGQIPHASIGPFFEGYWDLPWGCGSYHRTTVHLATRNMRGMSVEGLPPRLSAKSQYLTNVPPHQALYKPSETSRIESQVFPPDEYPIDLEETACAYASIGRGFLGYVGDVNAEETTTRVIMAMIHLSPNAVVPDTRIPGHIIVKRNENGEPEYSRGYGPSTSSDSEHPFYTDAIRRAGESFRTGHRKGLPKELPPRKFPGDALKEKGNKFFKGGKYAEAIDAWKEAIELAGRAEPIYLTNLAAAYLKVKSNIMAIESCDMALAIEPKNVKARYRRGLARREETLYRGALQDFAACTKLAPNDQTFTREIEKTWEEYRSRITNGTSIKEDVKEDETFDGEDFVPPLP